jgi:HemY protein
MRALFWGLLLAALGIALALLGRDVGGQVLFFAPPLRIEMSLFAFALALLVVLVAVAWLGALSARLGDFPRRVAAYRTRRAEAGAQRALRDTLRALLEGRFARAERAARDAQAHPAQAGLAALLGARAAHRLQQTERRDEWLAQVADADLATARLVTSAELWADGRENERALDAIDRLQASGSRHLHAARVALTANLQAGRWEQVLKGVRLLTKRSALHPAAADRYRLLAYRQLLSDKRHDGGALEAAWLSIPTDERRAPELALQGARLLNLAGRGRQASVALEEALEKRWDERLIDEYARAQAFPARERIERAERWRARHPQDPALLRCLGLLCLREQLWGKAKSYLEESLRLATHPATLLALARLSETIGQEADAARHYREAAIGWAHLQQPADEPPRGGVRAAGRDAAL